ncbi:NAD(P)-binding domain-containing protein [Peptoniphilus sp. KCTC 25270]|uniref:NAD(P)-dependent oxidoreductase n=1 Tax=Peptoniphilus sp. KCTC 25270 TaxID=2897414 RepID=UPI001E45EA88|nr:NAD(P)-dependent oxidoreductase [Peptoniphilus sp. KCTC 25270]MCD1147106.1 NAD(P)-binding domain-containing protein [Peptoniphilus sp. KCTC 25270]
MKLFISSRIPESILKKLEGFTIQYHDSNVPLTKEELMEGVKDCEILLCPLSDKIDKEILNSSSTLKMVANYGAGYDNIDIEEAKRLGIVVTNAPAPSSAVSTAELAFGIMLAQARQIVQGEKDLRKGNFHGWRPTYFLGNQLKGKTLGIIGLGNIGKNLAKRAEAFEMNVVYFSRTRKEDFETEHIRYADFDTVIQKADFLSLHTAFHPDLHHMINKDVFAAMKNSAILINAARGPLVKEDDLVEALKSGEIAGAALDVYEFEPKVTKELFDLEQVTLVPHLGNATYEARLEMGEACVDNIMDFGHSKKPRNQVNG